MKYSYSFYAFYLLLIALCSYAYAQGILQVHIAIAGLFIGTGILITLYILAYKPNSIPLYSMDDLYHPDKFIRREARKVYGYTTRDFEDSDPVIRTRAYVAIGWNLNACHDSDMRVRLRAAKEMNYPKFMLKDTSPFIRQTIFDHYVDLYIANH